MKICVIGAGHVGLVTSACLAHLGHSVVAVDSDRKRIRNLKKGIMPFYEPGMEQLVRSGVKKKKLVFSDTISSGVRDSGVIFICVGTPPKEDGETDLSSVESVVMEIARCISSHHTIVEKSTVPVNTWQWIKRTIDLYKKRNASFDVTVNPEFLREGSAVRDFLEPDRIVIGADSPRAKEDLLEIYRKIDCPKVITNLPTAEIIKHASNSFLATKISFINSVANLCERVGADVMSVSEGMGYDPRIGKAFLSAGAGYGGFCFPKDIASFIHNARKSGYDFLILKAVQKVNEEQKKLVARKVKESLLELKGKIVGVLGLAYKPNTDDMRLAPSIDIIKMLQSEGAVIKAFDPAAMHESKKLLRNVKFCRNAYEALNGSSCMLVLTEWAEFKTLDFNRIKKYLKAPIVIDARNMLDAEKLRKMGFAYKGIGR